jgi:hypothetical protein
MNAVLAMPLPDRADYYLRLWAEWMSHDDHGLGFPRRSLALCTGGDYSAGEDAFELECEKVDAVAARAADAAVSDLPAEYQAVIHAQYVAAVYRFRRAPSDMLADAMHAFLMGMHARGFA